MKPKKSLSVIVSACLLTFILFMQPIFVNSAALDKSLFTGNKKELLEKFRSMLKSKNNTPEQRILILTLIKILNSKPKLPEIENLKVKNQDDFLIFLKRVARLKLLKISISKKLEEINEKLSLTVSYQVDYQNLLPEGVEYHTDKLFLTGVSYNF